MNTNHINIQCAEDLRLLHTVSCIVKHYEQHHQNEITVQKVNVYGQPYELVYCNCKRIHDTYERIVRVNGYSGYVVLDDNTIVCVDSSDWIFQFDGCDEREVNMNVE